MTPPTRNGPFDGPPAQEIDLADAPLARVLTQVKFEPLAIFSTRTDPVGGLVEHLLDEFPLLENAFETEITVGPNGIEQKATNSKIWRLKTNDSATTVSVSNGSLALETSNYVSRKQFVAAVERIIQGFAQEVARPPVTRVGIRYSNRIVPRDGDVYRLKRMLRAEAHGGLAVEVPSGTTLQHSLQDWSFILDDGAIQARSGILPENAVYDPTLPPLPERHWFLDIDSYAEGRRTFAPDDLIGTINELAVSAYNLFRWVVTDEFISEFGGKA